jgi:replicative DNA helicase Mcm
MQEDSFSQVDEFKDFFESVYSDELLDVNKKGGDYILIDFSELSKFSVDLAEHLLNDPGETLLNAELGIDQMGLSLKNKIRVRLSGLPDSQYIKIRDIRSNNIDSFLVIEGIVRQASDVRPQVVSAKFECPTCGNVLSILQLEASFKEPSRCSCGRQGKFRLLSKELVDAQRLVIEEAPEDLDGGDQPKRLSVFLKEDLVEPKMEKKTTPGSKIRITGAVKEIPVFLKTGAQSTRFDLIMEANYVEPLQETFEGLDFSKEEEERIKRLSKDPKIWTKLISTIAPTIYGYNEIKASLLLQLFGGRRKTLSDGLIKRGDIHILLVGDPGAGKSQLLQFIGKAAPKARFVSGKGASGAGLTAAVVKDEFLKGWSLEAGAMVLANKGLCAIDELDKMSPEDRSALHEALEQQTVTISKANIQATLRAETTVLAAANPKQGRFDPYTPIASQIDLPPALISRFDLIFPIRDLPNREQDTNIASHILDPPKEKDISSKGIDLDLLRKYISYSKNNIKPVLSEGAKEEIKKFYVDLRNNPSSPMASEQEIKPIPVTPRQLEAIVRLAEASARVKLSKTITKHDAKLAISLLKYCLTQVGFDEETQSFDIDRLSTGISASERGRMVTVKEIIQEIEARSDIKTVSLDEIKSEASDKGIPEDKLIEIIEKLKRSGDLFEPKRGHIQRI